MEARTLQSPGALGKVVLCLLHGPCPPQLVPSFAPYSVGAKGSGALGKTGLGAHPSPLHPAHPKRGPPNHGLQRL